MSFAQKYFERYQTLPKQIHELPQNDLHYIVVIPCINEPDIIKTLSSLLNADKPTASVEIIVVINSSAGSTANVVAFNKQTYLEIETWSNEYTTDTFKCFPLLFEALPRKHAGAGLARKIGMDEAIRRFDCIHNNHGVIISLDADSLVEANYFREIEACFSDANCFTCNLHFEHPVEGDEFSESTYRYIALYELHLRYLRQAYRYTGFPYAYHTIGSAFAVRAELYVKQGGMNKRTAGEDFYFLHKLFPQGGIKEIFTTKVIPSPRASDRVPFGTGASMSELLKNENTIFYTYNISVFEDLKVLFDFCSKIYCSNDPEGIINTLSPALKTYLLQEECISKIQEIKRNVASETNFTKRFYNWFDAFRIVKFINFAHEGFYHKQDVCIEAQRLFERLSHAKYGDGNASDLLKMYRKFETQ